MNFPTICYYLILLSFSINVDCYSQVDSQIKVSYLYLNEMETLEEALFASESHAVYIKYPHSEAVEGGIVVKGNITKEPSYKYATPELKFYSFASTEEVVMHTVDYEYKKFIAIDSTLALKWELIDSDIVMIAGFKCNKARLTWRGRDYTAFYTTDIPIPFGPYKFKGLPGLILQLESYSQGNFHKWVASSIRYPYRDDLKITPIDKLDGERITLANLLLRNDRIQQEQVNATRARLPENTILTKQVSQRRGVEVVFEWETRTDGKKEF